MQISKESYPLLRRGCKAAKQLSSHMLINTINQWQTQPEGTGTWTGINAPSNKVRHRYIQQGSAHT
jgi:hypothetical protein